jgi:uncharacterized protein YjbI with pentapeptide repeats
MHHKSWSSLQLRAVLMMLFFAAIILAVHDFASSGKGDQKGQAEKNVEGNTLRNRPQIKHRMEGAVLDGEDFHETMMAGVRLRKAKLKKANLRMAMLAGADLRQADLEHADLHDAMLLGANLSGANLMHANLDGAMLFGATLEGTRIERANFRNALVSQDQIDDACGRPEALPFGLVGPPRSTC